MEYQEAKQAWSQARKDQEIIKAAIYIQQGILDAEPEYKAMKELQEQLKKVKEQEEAARQEILGYGQSIYDRTGEKHPILGVQIKEFQTFEIVDDRAAKKWFAANAPAAVTLNMAEVGKIVKAMDLSFVMKNTEFRPNIITKELE